MRPVLQDHAGVKTVSFKVSRPDGQYGLHKIGDTTFELGLGPCGRWVERLEVVITDHLVRITQHSVGMDLKEVYRENRESAYAIRRGGLTADLKEYHQERYNVTCAILRKAREDYEIKEFVYKMGDIHGRIVTTR